MSKPTILFIKTMNSTFIRLDEQILRDHYSVYSFLYKPGNAIRMAISLIQLKLWLFARILTADLLFIWFADYHALLPVLFAKIFRKKSVVLLGGMDAVKIPEVNQGVYLRPFRAFCARFAIRHCNLIISCDESLIETVNSYASDPPLKAGVKNLVKNFNTPFTIIPFGFDEQKWKPGTGERKKLVLSVAIVKNLNKLKLKGLDLLTEVAIKFPQYQFMIIGASGFGEKLLQKNKPGNLIVSGPVKNDELVSYYQQAKVYAQLSLSEGLPNVLCEAMLCGCVPVGSNVNGIPKAIGNTGFIVKTRDADEAANAIKQALEADNKMSQAARERIISLFSLKQRKEKLIREINRLLEKR